MGLDLTNVILPKWNESGQCRCGFSLPKLREWKDAGRDWATTRCPSCQLVYVEEEDEIRVYEPECIVIPRSEILLLLAALDHDDVVTWGAGSTFDEIAAKVGFEPVGPASDIWGRGE